MSDRSHPLRESRGFFYYGKIIDFWIKMDYFNRKGGEKQRLNLKGFS